MVEAADVSRRQGDTEAPLTFGQLSTWRTNAAIPEELRSQWHLPRVWPVPAGCKMADVQRALRSLVRKHEALRTVVHVADDGRLSQMILADAEAVVHAHQADLSLDEAYDRARTLARAPIDLVIDRPWRAEVIVGTDDAPAYVIVAFHHFGADQWGLRILERDFDAEVRGAHGSGPAWRPRELAAWQRSPAHGRMTARVADHWRAIGRKSPATAGGEMSFSRTAERIRGRVGSPALRTSMERIALATRHSMADLVLAVFTISCPQVLDQAEEPFVLMSSNRFDRRWRETVTSMNQLAVVDMPAAVKDLPELLPALRKATRTALLCGSYDFDEFTEIFAHERGSPMKYDYVYNFIATGSPTAMTAGRDIDPQPAEVLIGTAPESSGPRLDLAVTDHNGMTIDVRCDETVLSRTDLHHLLSDLYRRVLATARTSGGFS